MDFRQCPACQASVLDDDATECPFCGASMSGKPSAAPAKPAAPAKTKGPATPPAKGGAGVPAKPQAAAPRGPARKVGETVADDDDPFGIDTSTVTRVPSVAPKPMKGRTIKIECQMCGTPGYISSKMQGQDVRCANPKCMVPVFKAPRPSKKEDVTIKKASPFAGKPMWITGGLVALLAVFLFWAFYLSRQHAGVVAVPSPPPVNVDVPPDEAAADPAGGAPQAPTGPAISLSDIKKDSLAKIITSAQTNNEGNRKAYSRRLAAEAHALAGDVKGARNQIEHLQKASVGGRVPYFQVEPLLLIGWYQLANGKQAEAQQAFEQATQAYTGISQVGRDVLSAGIVLATAQAAFDQIPQAQQTLRQLEAERERARVAAVLHIAADFETFDVDDLMRHTMLDMAVDPLAVAVTIDVAAHAGWDKAIVWAMAQSDPAAREDCLEMLATFAALRSAQTGKSDAVEQLQAISGLTPTGLTRVQAGLAAGSLMGGKKAEAEAALAKAQASLATIEKPAAIATPSVKDVHDSDGKPNAGLPASSPLHSAAEAVMQVARVQALLGQQEAAWATLLQAFEFTAGMGPNAAAIGAMTDELDRNKALTERKIQQQLKPRNNDAAYQAINRYRHQLRDFESAAKQRFDLERALLFAASSLRMQAEVEAFRANPGGTVAAAAGQPFQQTADDDAFIKLVAETERLFAAKQYKQAGEALAAFRSPGRRNLDERRDLWALQLASRLAKLKQVDPLLVYIAALDEDGLTEDALEVTSAYNVLNGQAPKLWTANEQYGLQPTEKVALYRGLVGGIVVKVQRGAAQ